MVTGKKIFFRAGWDRRAALAAALAVTVAGALCSCATAPEQIATPVTVEVPVARPVYCPAAQLGKPALPIAALSGNSAPADTMRAYAATVAILKGAVAQRDEVIAGCAAPPSVDEPHPLTPLPSGEGEYGAKK